RGLWKVAGRSFITQHILHPAERELFDTDARMSGKRAELTKTEAPLVPLQRREVRR
ncbi:ATP-binding protein, partial [Streptomyces sp. ADMS]|nr:ATP-binding protein [Streptomyces sp. ADMS]